MRMYSVYDKMREEFNLPFGALSDDIATRDFGFACLKNPFYSDLELFYVGYFNSDTAFFESSCADNDGISIVKPQFVCNGASAVALFKKNYADDEVEKNV